MKLKTSQELRAEFTLTLTCRNKLLDRMRNGDKTLTEHERQACWVALSDLSYSISNSHYRQKQTYKQHTAEWYTIPYAVYEKKATKHSERMMLILEFLKEYKHLPVQLCVSRIKRRFTWLELLLDTRLLGINLDLGCSISRAATKCLVRDIIKGLSIQRSLVNPTVREVTIEYAYQLTKKTGRFPTYHRLEVFSERYSKYVESVKYASPQLESELPDGMFQQFSTDDDSD